MFFRKATIDPRARRLFFGIFLLLFVFVLPAGSLAAERVPGAEAPSEEKEQAAAPDASLWNHYSLFSIVRALAMEGDILWVGTSNGLLKYDLASGKQEVYTTKNGLLSNIVHSITVGPKGGKWIGTIGGGLSRLSEGKWTSYTPYGAGSHASYQSQWQAYQRGEGLGDLWVYGTLFDQQGELWVATWKGVSHFDGKGFKTFNTEDGLIDKWVYTLNQDREGTLWFGTEGGVSRFDGKSWKSWTHEDGVGADLARITPPQAQAVPFTPKHHEGNHKPLTYNPNYVVSSAVDADNHLWIGTLGGGLSRFDGKKWQNYSTRDGLAGDMVHAITIDDKGILWIGTDGGVSRFDGRQFSNLTKKDGIGAVFSIAIDREGHKWFGTFGGVSQYLGH